ncbi:hypothetical protein PAMC26510_26590 [Caballeronia sordidicola]|uniref:Uncharacterized protein n=1 Tax=Caballeronia sordidicola TaxID=196367 RepID=A0A242MFV1_CABSO|nr:hypothetical protein PAMC26510_26590 [Caballeronia sordidicola]
MELASFLFATWTGHYRGWHCGAHAGTKPGESLALRLA